MDKKHGRAGFSLIELIIAVVILTVGLLGFASTTGFMFRQSTMAKLRTKRVAAVVSVVENLKAQTFENVTYGGETVGDFSMSWTSLAIGIDTKLVRIISTGPGARSTVSSPMPALSDQVADTFTYRLLRP